MAYDESAATNQHAVILILLFSTLFLNENKCALLSSVWHNFTKLGLKTFPQNCRKRTYLQ